MDVTLCLTRNCKEKPSATSGAIIKIKQIMPTVKEMLSLVL